MLNEILEKITDYSINKLADCKCKSALTQFYLLTICNIDEKEKQEILNNLENSIKNKKVDYDTKLKCPVLYLEKPIQTFFNTVDKLYMKKSNVNRPKTDITKQLAFVFCCSPDVIKNISSSDFNIACGLMYLPYIV